MSLAEILQELPAFTVAERQLLIRRAIELDDSELSAEDEKLIASRLEDHRNDPSTAVTLETIKESIRSRFSN
jgi:putative addiction module component (TIGR02574 family)